MKQTLISILLLKATLLNCISIQAQNDKTTGIYSTANDFRSGILIKKIDCNSNNKIRVNNFFGTTDITVKENNIVTKIKKSAVYGYKSCKNENYRFYNNEEFKIIDTGGIYIYSEYHYENPVKGKGAPIKMEGFHYSITPEGEIYP